MSMVLPGVRGRGPKLRDGLEFLPIEEGGEQLLLLRDPFGIAPEPVALPLPLVPIAVRLDGNHSIEQIVHEGSVLGLTLEIVQNFLAELGSCGYLETDSTRERLRMIAQDFIASPVRPAAHAGVVYPAEPGALTKRLDEIVAGCDRKASPTAASGDVPMLMCPHIDYQRGWQGYGAAYSVLEQMDRPDLIVLIGTSHYGGESIFQLTRKDFHSPNGVLPNARSAVDRLSAQYGTERSFRDELLHRREHSLELQVPFLLHHYGDRPPLIVPVLVGSFHSMLVTGKDPMEDEEVATFVGALGELLSDAAKLGQRVLVYNGVDLAHIGQFFGDTERMAPDKLPAIEERDRKLLDAVLIGDERQLFAHMAEDTDRRRVCGFPSLWTSLAAFRAAGQQLRGALVDYRQAADPTNDCTVTFASAFWRRF